MMFELIWSNLKYIMSHAIDIHIQGQAQISPVFKVVYSNTMPQKQMHYDPQEEDKEESKLYECNSSPKAENTICSAI